MTTDKLRPATERYPNLAAHAQGGMNNTVKAGTRMHQECRDALAETDRLTSQPRNEPPPPKRCAFCGQSLQSVNETWENYQPYGGGEVKFIFGYGSETFDDSIESTVFRGVICDWCAEAAMTDMDRVV